jgi:hypothetical protein
MATTHLLVCSGQILQHAAAVGSPVPLLYSLLQILGREAEARAAHMVSAAKAMAATEAKAAADTTAEVANTHTAKVGAPVATAANVL